MRKLFMTFSFLMIGIITLNAAIIDTLQVFSKSMNKNVNVICIIPEGLKNTRLPVLYLLHGYSGNEKSWLNIKPELPQIVDSLKMIIVCPDGKNSWYWDSPENKSYKYETFISKELVQYIDKNYKTIPRKEARAITGLSMGGHGALWNALRHQDVFGAAGSTSGGVDIIPFTSKWEIHKLLGNYIGNEKKWQEYTIVGQLYRLHPKTLTLIIDCGSEDFFLQVNNELHQLLLNRNIPHDFIIRPGAHNKEYWNNSIDYQLLFFKKFFSK